MNSYKKAGGSSLPAFYDSSFVNRRSSVFICGYNSCLWPPGSCSQRLFLLRYSTVRRMEGRCLAHRQSLVWPRRCLPRTAFMIDRAAPAHPLRTNRCFVFMRSILGILSAVLILFPLGLTARAEKVEQLKPQGYVNDFAGVLSAPARSQMTALCTEVDQKAHAQVAVVTIRSLEGIPLQEFANRLFKQWAVGYKPDDRGVLVLLAVSDRKYWVEVGYGLEPILPDGKVGGFGREIVPLLRQNDYGGAMLQLTSRIAEVIAQDRGVTLGSRLPMKPRERESRRIPQGAVLLFLLAIAVIGKVI